jgi:glycogen debranching enzyme
MMVNPWTPTAAPPSLAQQAAAVTLVEGAEFLVAGPGGDFHPGSPHGLFFLDTRFLSRLELAVDGVPPEPLDVVTSEPFSAMHVLRSSPRSGHADAQLMVFRRRWIGRGMREEIVLRNYGHEPLSAQVTLAVGADFADLFEVKEQRVQPRGEYWQRFRRGRFSFGLRRSGFDRAVHLRFSDPPVSGPQLGVWEAEVPPQGSWELGIEVAFTVEGSHIEPRFPLARPVEEAEPQTRIATWRARLPAITTDYEPLAVATRQAAKDLGVLRIHDPDHPDDEVIAAGAPWFMTLFGRDSLLTAWMALLVDPTLARGVLRTLARFQGQDVDPRTEEEPGRILHEMRFASAGSLALGGGSIYYGTADATPLFVMLLGEVRRWGLVEEDALALLPAAERALAWIDQFGDRDGDGYVEYGRATPNGLLHQGWKDSWDSMRFIDGRHAEPPIALAEVQAYVYGAWIARAHWADQAGDHATAHQYAVKAAELKRRFNDDFWLEEHGWYAMALDADKRPVDALASNMGHCLWTGIVDEDRAPLVARRLASPELFSGWGIRTMASSMAAYNPASYHCGSVWPHDTAIGVAGLMRYGFVEEAHGVIMGLLDVAALRGGRLPELFCGFPRDEVGAPVGYPTSCSPQAWAAAAPLHLVRSLLRFDPWVPRQRLWIAPALPSAIRRLRVEGIPLKDSRTTVVVEDGSVEVTGLPAGIDLIREPRRPLSSYLDEALR